jgi:hypothetical protein
MLSTLTLFALVATLPLAGSTITVTNLLDSGPGSLRSTIAAAANGDTIVFGVSGVISLSNPLNIGTNLTINGFGIAINGSISGTIFDVTGSASDIFSNLTLLNATNAFTGSSNASVSLIDSTVSGSAGGLVSINATVTNSTLSGNTVAISGGTVSLYDSTISGGNFGIVNTSLTIGNSIIYGNATDVGSGNTVTDSGHNLIGSGGGLFVNGSNGDIVGASPNLGPFANNGGPTLTYALLAGSPAIDAGNNAIIPAGVTTDQRGAGFDRISGGTVDIGAYEVQQTQTPEPATCLTCLLGFAISAWRLRKR